MGNSHLKDINIEFTTFLIKNGMEDEAEKWMSALVSRRNECVATLREEKMHFESIFKTVRDGRVYLSWFSVQGTGGKRRSFWFDVLQDKGCLGRRAALIGFVILYAIALRLIGYRVARKWRDRNTE